MGIADQAIVYAGMNLEPGNASARCCIIRDGHIGTQRAVEIAVDKLHLLHTVIARVQDLGRPLLDSGRRNSVSF